MLSVKELTPQQLAAMELMLRGLSDAQVAAQLGVDRGTVFRWRKSPKFAAELDQHRRRLIEQSTARLQTLLDPALNVLEKQLTGDDPKHALRAAAILVRLATPARLTRASPRGPDPRDRALDDLINAPVPDGGPAHRAAMAELEEDDET